MPLELKKETLKSTESLCKQDTQKNVDFEVTLPDYCTDVKKVLKCFITPGINSHSAIGDTVKISGNVILRLVYINEKDKVDCFEEAKDFICEIKTGDIPEDACIVTEVKTNYVNCRALSQRKLTVSTNLSVGVCVSTVEDCTVVTDIDDASVEKKLLSQKAQEVLCRREKIFDLGETAALPDSMPPVQKVLNTRGYVVITGTKAVSDKMLLKGQLVTEVLYLCDCDSGKTDLFRHTMPISQIIDLPGIDENSLCTCTGEIKQLNISVKADASKENRLMEIGAKISADVNCTRIKELTVIEDAYSTSREFEGEYALTGFLCPLQTAEKQHTHKQTFSLPTEKVKEISGVILLGESCSAVLEGDEVTFNCSALVGILYLDDSDCMCYIERAADFSLSEKLIRETENLTCSPKLKIKTLDYRLSGKDKVDISLEAEVFGDICSGESKRILRGGKLTDKKAKPSAALTLYFADEGEDLWEIAKRYSTSSRLILRENALEETQKIHRGMIMIPSV